MDSASVTILDTPATSSAVSYKVQFAIRSYSSSYYCTHVNYQIMQKEIMLMVINNYFNNDLNGDWRMTSVLKVTEIQDPTNSNSAATIGSDGLFKAVAFQVEATRMYPNAAQSLAHGTVTVLNFTNTSFDSDKL